MQTDSWTFCAGDDWAHVMQQFNTVYYYMFDVRLTLILIQH